MAAVCAVMLGASLFNGSPANAQTANITRPPIASVETHRPAPAEIGDVLARMGKLSIEQRMKAHRDAIERTGLGTMYGDHSWYKTMSPEDRAKWIEENTKPGTVPPHAHETSCIGWAMENVGAAYRMAGKGARWDEIERIVVANGSRGIVLARELEKDGWQGVYFNPDTKHPSDGSGEHTVSWRIASHDHRYYGIRIDHYVVDYAPADGSPTHKDERGLSQLEKVPFFFGMARGGYHTFVGHDGVVNDGHWMDMPNDPDVVKDTPLGQFEWLSGAILIPPGTWPG